MKKYFHIFLLMLTPFVLTSCGDDDDDDFFLIGTSIETRFGGNAQIPFTGKLPKVFVENEFIATVDKNGLVSAQHAGHTVAHIGDKTMDIYINGATPLIGDICYEWGKGKQYVFNHTTFKDFKKSSSTQSDTYVGAKIYKDQPIVVYGYNFEKDQDKLESVSILVHKSYSQELASFLKERFLLAEYTDVVGNMLVGLAGFDAYTSQQASSMVSVSEFSDIPNYYYVLIIPYSIK